ncbi:hypothetical protein EV426DRAFT_702895 [Tirmania nivea]|nr:hypothetical protein EV426DRAFT_702895 [Tirmania nivea]
MHLSKLSQRSGEEESQSIKTKRRCLERRPEKVSGQLGSDCNNKAVSHDQRQDIGLWYTAAPCIDEGRVQMKMKKKELKRMKESSSFVKEAYGGEGSNHTYGEFEAGVEYEPRKTSKDLVVQYQGTLKHTAAKKALPVSSVYEDEGQDISPIGSSEYSEDQRMNIEMHILWDAREISDFLASGTLCESGSEEDSPVGLEFNTLLTINPTTNA